MVGEKTNGLALFIVLFLRVRTFHIEARPEKFESAARYRPSGLQKTSSIHSFTENDTFFSPVSASHISNVRHPKTASSLPPGLQSMEWVPSFISILRSSPLSISRSQLLERKPCHANLFPSGLNFTFTQPLNATSILVFSSSYNFV